MTKKPASKNGKFPSTVYVSETGSFDEKMINSLITEDLRAVVLILDFGKLHSAASLTNETVKAVSAFPVPVITAITGDVTENWIPLVEASHLCIASDASRFTISNDRIDAIEACKIGLINQSVSDENVESAANELAGRISELAPLAIRAFITAVDLGMQTEISEGLKIELELFQSLFETNDMREGTAAFFEKRKAVFSGI